MDAYKEGKQAFLDGKSVDDNPYPYPSAEWTYFWDGYTDAQCRMEG